MKIYPRPPDNRENKLKVSDVILKFVTMVKEFEIFLQCVPQILDNIFQKIFENSYLAFTF